MSKITDQVNRMAQNADEPWEAARKAHANQARLYVCIAIVLERVDNILALLQEKLKEEK